MRKALVETAQWRLVATVIDVAVLWMWTGSPWQAGWLALTLLVLKTGAFLAWRLLQPKVK